jgi:serine protease Do
MVSMDKQFKKEFPRSSTLFVAIIIGALVGVGIYQAAAKGILPLKVRLPATAEVTPGQKIQTIVDEENAVIDVVEKTSPSVVAIGTTRRVFNPYDPFSIPRSQSATIGTGFVISDKGIIVTNKHVVDDRNSTYTVITRDDKKYEIRKIYRDPVLDLAIVQIDSDGSLKALDLGDSSKLKIGQTVIAIGNALGRFTNTVTTGIVSGVGRRVVAGDPFTGSYESLDDLIQTDAAINPGNSGGPLLNSSGQVIGVNVATTEGAQNIGFAIPIDAVKKITDEFIKTGSVSRPFLGVQYQFVSKDLALLNEMPQGAYVREVIKDSGADKAGVKIGDVIIRIDGKTVDSDGVISGVIASKRIGDTIPLVLWSDGKERTVNATLQELPNQ